MYRYMARSTERNQVFELTPCIKRASFRQRFQMMYYKVFFGFTSLTLVTVMFKPSNTIAIKTSFLHLSTIREFLLRCQIVVFFFSGLFYSVSVSVIGFFPRFSFIYNSALRASSTEPSIWISTLFTFFYRVFTRSIFTSARNRTCFLYSLMRFKLFFANQTFMCVHSNHICDPTINKLVRPVT
jgi:hypothetical protein